MDKRPASEIEDASVVLTSWLEDYAAGKCAPADLQDAFLSICRRQADASWDALALLDQYQRRGKVDGPLVRDLKARISQLAFGVPENSQSWRETTIATLDPSGSRWQQLMVERGGHAPTLQHRRRDATDHDAEDEETDESDEDARHQRPLEQPTLARREPVVRATPPPPAPAARSDAPAVSPSTHVLRERYALTSLLRRTHAVSVYLATDQRRAHLDDSARHVLVKVFNADWRTHPAWLTDLERSFQRVQSLSHPNIARTFDLDRDGDTFFLVEEHLEGMPLVDILHRLQGRPMDRALALNVIGGMGAALAYAHRHGIAHGELRPGNVMITHQGDVKVLNFGADRYRTQAAEDSATHPESVMADAVPAYASIERITGEAAQPVDDVYSLGCVAYQLLSGRHPFGGRSSLQAQAHGLRPKRITGLDSGQWQALRKALRYSRTDRKIDVAGFMGAMGCGQTQGRLVTPPEVLAPPRRTGTILRHVVTAILLLAVAAVLVWFVIGVRQSLSVTPAPSVDETSSATPEPVAAASAPVAEDDSPPESDGPPGAAPPAPVASAPTTAPARSAVRTDTVGFQRDTYFVIESAGAVQVTVRRQGSTAQPAAFRWTLREDSAGAGSDFADIGPGREVIPIGANAVTITIPLVSDALPEDQEMFAIELIAEPGSAALSGVTTAHIVIEDDD